MKHALATLIFEDGSSGSEVKNLPGRPLGGEDPLEEKMATHSSILAWEILRTEETGGLQSMGLQRFGNN